MIEILHGIHETVNHKQGTGFRLYDNVQNESYPAHWHSELEIIMPIEGPYEVSIADNVYVLQPDDIIVINSGVVHTLKPYGEGRRLIFQPDFTLLHSIKGLESVLTFLPPAFVLTKETDENLHAHLKDILLKIQTEYFSERPLSEAAVYSLLIEMFVRIGREYSDRLDELEVTGSKKKEYTEKFMDVCNYINEHCTEDLNLDDTAAMVGFSKYHFTRLFKQFCGYSFYKYLSHKRIEHAEKLLMDPDNSITEVATSSGFSSLSAFIRMFKEVKGCTPTEFRNMYYC